MTLQTAKNDFFRQVNDLQQQNQGKKSNAHSTGEISKDYCPAAAGMIVPDAFLAMMAPATNLYTPSRLPSLFAATAENPPEQI